MKILALVIIFVIAVYLNYYVCNKLYNIAYYLNFKNKKLFFSIYFFIASSLLLNILFSKILPNKINKVILYISIYYMAIFSHLLLFSLVYDLLSLILKLFKLNKKVNKRNIIIGFIIIFLTTLSVGFFNFYKVKVVKYNIPINKLSKNDNIKIILISDIHLGEYINNKKICKLVNQVNKLNPDLILIAGDLVDSDIAPFIKYEMHKDLGKLSSTYGTYFSLGNHDIYTKSINTLTNLLESENINVLRDTYKLIDNKFYIIGRDDYQINNFSSPRKALSEIIKDINTSKPLILIDHNPKYYQDAIDNNIDLQVSGHTHKGQIFPLNIGIKILYKINYGHKNIKNSNIVVSSGYGIWGPPIRIGSQSEIVEINLTG